MATSGDTSWALTRNQIVASAYRKLGVPSDVVTIQQLTDGYEALNEQVSLMITKGMHLWKRQTSSFTPSTTSQIYSLPTADKVVQVYLSDVGGAQYEIYNKSLYDFNNLPTQAIGKPVYWTYQPIVPMGGNLSIWPLTSDATTVANTTIKVVYQSRLYDFVAATDTIDFPTYWTHVLVLATALALAPEVGLALQDRSYLKAQYDEALKDCQGYGDEDGSLYLLPSRQ